MAKSNMYMLAKKIAKGINFKYGTHLVINVSEFYRENGQMVRMYICRDSYYGRDGYINEELFKTASGVFMVFFMRDMMNVIEGKETVDDSEDPGWRALKEKKRPDLAYQYILENYIYDIVDEEVDENVRFAGNNK